jgi:hypothetical protein
MIYIQHNGRLDEKSCENVDLRRQLQARRCMVTEEHHILTSAVRPHGQSRKRNANGKTFLRRANNRSRK